MNIVMLSNTYLPHVGGVARSVEAFSAEYRKRGHRVLVIAPEFEGAPAEERDIIRVPAIQNFNGSDFSARLPIPGYVSASLGDFQPELIHSHHPFLLGDTALRMAANWNIPLVFTHHTMYEWYTHYVPGESSTLQRYVRDLSTGYANLCDQVFAPSESVATVLRERGVEVPIKIVPTGVDPSRFAEGDAARIREESAIPLDALVVGHVGRLAPEKNLHFLAEAVAAFLSRRRDAHFLVVGSGPSEEDIRRLFSDRRLTGRLHLAGTRQGQALVDAYCAMDVFAFASRTETQGMVLTEAMAAGLPVVALDAPGVREVVRDGKNGRLLPRQQVSSFATALQWISDKDDSDRRPLCDSARTTAKQFSMSRCAEEALCAYRNLVRTEAASKTTHKIQGSAWESALRVIEAEWGLWAARTHAAGAALRARRWWPIATLLWLVDLGRRLRRVVSRNQWVMRLLGLPPSTHNDGNGTAK